MHDLPASLRISSPFPFVGRSAELETLRTLLPTAEGEGRRVVLLGGEPGSGKSRLVREFAGEAARDGALVLYGACDAVVRTPYGALRRRSAASCGRSTRRSCGRRWGAGAASSPGSYPISPSRIGVLPPPVRADPNTERHRLHTTVTELLEAVSRRRPVLLAIEDGHWADATTLLLLRHLARSRGVGRVLLFATFRDTEADMPEALAETLADCAGLTTWCVCGWRAVG